MRVEKNRNTCLIDKISKAFFVLASNYSVYRNIVKNAFLYFFLKPESNRAKFSPIKNAELNRAEIKDAILLDKTNTLQAVPLSQ